MKNDAILVTGLGGLIGGAVARRLADAGRVVVGMDRAAPTDARFPVIVHDLPDPDRWHEAITRHRVRKVVHAGGISGPMLPQDAPVRLCDVNIGGLLGLLEAARIHKLERVVWFSSILAYGDRPDLTAVSEDTPLHPNTIYGATKASGEALIEAFYAEHGVDAVSFRVASCYGPGRTTACLMRTLVEDGLDGKTTVVRDAPERTRQHIFVDDVVDAVCAALDAGTFTRRAYNIGPGTAQSLNQIVDAVRSAVPGTSVAYRLDGLSWNTFGLGALLIDAARRDFAFGPRVSLAEGAARTREWVEKRRAGLRLAP
jgi:nucleoside-diphosphate-sugar epimerase